MALDRRRSVVAREGDLGRQQGEPDARPTMGQRAENRCAGDVENTEAAPSMG